MGVIKRLLFFLLLPASLQAANITGAWFTTSEKVARQDLWPHGTCSTCAITTNWNGKNAYMFGAKGEILHGITYLQNNSGSNATNVNVSISSFTDNNGHFIIPLVVSSGSVWNSNLAGPVNLFYVRYLPIRGESQESWDVNEIDARDLPPLFRVPCTGTAPCAPTGATQLWTNRQDHDKFYPEIEVPYELVKASSFTVAASSSQAIALDVYIATDTFVAANASYNIFYATMTIRENVTISTTVPITLKVYSFTMPTRPRLPVIAALGTTHMDYFHYNSSGTYVGEPRTTTHRHYYEYLWRNGIIPIGDDKCNLASCSNGDFPSNEYKEQLDGTLYTPANGFGNSPRVSSGVTFYMIGTYANWIDPVHFSSVTITGGSGAFCSNVSSWSVNLGNYPGLRSALYLYDEPDSSMTLRDDVDRLASVMQSTCAMNGTFINSWVTSAWVETMSSAPHVNMPAAGIWSVSTNLQSDWPIAASLYETTGSTQGWGYNGHPPAGGTFFATEDTGQSAELFGPSAFKTGVQGWFLWEVVNWDNPNNSPIVNDLFNDAHTFGVDIYPATNGNTAVRGRNGFNYTNGDGVLLYPGHDTQDPANDYNMDGPMGGFRLKMVRNGINMYDYASMAYAVNPTSTTAILNTIVPNALYELQPVLNHGYYFTGRTWSDDPQVWESNRELLAQWIAAGSSSTITSALTATAVNGVSFTYQITANNNPQTFTATGLPTGLSLDSDTGLISGIVTPGQYATYNVTLTATNALGAGPSSTLALTVDRINLHFKTRYR